jgi:hypothetical protein
MAPISQMDIFKQYVTPLVVRVFSLFLINPEAGSSNPPETLTDLHQTTLCHKPQHRILLIINNFLFQITFICIHFWDVHTSTRSSIFTKYGSQYWYYYTGQHPENISWRRQFSHLDYSVCVRLCFQTVVYSQQLALTALHQAFHFLCRAWNNSSMKLLLGMYVYTEAKYI